MHENGAIGDIKAPPAADGVRDLRRRHHMITRDKCCRRAHKLQAGTNNDLVSIIVDTCNGTVVTAEDGESGASISNGPTPVSGVVGYRSGSS